MSANLTERDFIYFQIGNYTSTDLGLTRVSDGNRYNSSMLPTFNDKTAVVSGSDQTYYFRTDYTDLQITLDVAFDSMTEDQYRLLKRIFRDGVPKKLILSEAPYKYYMVKCSQAPQLKYLCFDEDDRRIYRGEGTLSFVAYYPYALGTYHFLGQFLDWYILTSDTEIISGKNYFTFNTTKNEYVLVANPIKSLLSTYYEFLGNQWALNESGQPMMPFNSDEYNKYNATTKKIPIYYNSPYSTNWKIKIKFTNTGTTEAPVYTIPATSLKLDNTEILNWDEIIRSTDTEVGIVLNSKTYTIESYDSSDNLINLYNNYITNNNFQRISQTGEFEFGIKDSAAIDVQSIEYNYIYE